MRGANRGRLPSMVTLVSAAVGLGLIAAGVSLIGSVVHRAAKLRQPVVLPCSAHPEHQFPVLSPLAVLEQTGMLGVLAIIEGKCGFSREHFERSVPPVIQAYAEFVQQRPAVESRRYARPGGLLMRALEVVDLALIFRRGQILPGGAAPEDIMRLEHRWTYAVLVAALLYDIGKLIAKLRITLWGADSKEPQIWTPLSGSMQECGAARYSIDFASKGECDDQLPQKLAVFLFQRWVTGDVLSWLSADRELMSELMPTLSGDPACGSGAIKALVLRADAESVNRDLLLGLREGDRSAGPIHHIAIPNSADERAPVENAIAVIEDTATSAGNGADVHPANGAPPVTEEHLDDAEELPHDCKSKSAVNHVGLTAPRPQLLPPVVPALPSLSDSGNSTVPPEAALRFMSWLQAGLADGTLTFNQTGAMVHFVAEGMLLVSPRIFQCFAKAFGEDGRGAVSSASGEKKDLGLAIQKQWLRADWHMRGGKGASILPYQVLRAGKPPARISGVVVIDPQRFVNPVPPANPHVVKVADCVEGVREHGLST